jgi:hypothetical protein
MREIYVVPTYKRPDFLYCCLEAIRAAEPELPLMVFPDRGTTEDEVCTKFNVQQFLTVEHSYHGNSYVMLEALKWAYEMAYERVFIIEDDAIISTDFFSWCRAALHSKPEAFAACGWQYSPDAIIRESGPDILMPWYLSVCACIPRKSLFGIVQHAHPAYYRDMGGYLDRAYPNSHRRGSRHYEQDGLVLRVAESEGKSCVWPRKPRAIHVGWHGYHTEGKALEGTLEERVAIVKLASQNPQLLKKLMDGAKPPDVERCAKCQKPLLSENKEAIKLCVACFHSEFPNLPVTTGSHYYLRSMITATLALF